MLNFKKTVTCFLLLSVFFISAFASERSEPGAFSAADLVALTGSFAEFSDDLPDVKKLGIKKITAYEEHKEFVYIRGSGTSFDRRIIFCKPDTFITYLKPGVPGYTWKLVCSNTPAVKGDRFSFTEGDVAVSGRIILPGNKIRTSQTHGKHLVEIAGANQYTFSRFLTVIRVGDKDSTVPEVTFSEKGEAVRLNVTTGDKKFTLSLPVKPVTPGTIAVSQSGKAVLVERLLPSGILPHGAEGVRELERWDSAYRRTGMPGWDVGRCATELRKAVEGGVIKPGRALVLGCGAGTNAIYLADKGFDVTGVDISPTALKLAEQRARKAKVKVTWLVADVLAVPPVGPFDFIFDRGCYHHVRRYNAAGFVNMATRLSRDKTLFMVLAGNANESRHYGPPRVEETDFVNDFAKTWDFVWLKEIRFDSSNPDSKGGPWAWSALVRRKGAARGN